MILEIPNLLILQEGKDNLLTLGDNFKVCSIPRPEHVGGRECSRFVCGYHERKRKRLQSFFSPWLYIP
jgi:hypothetical protein